MTVTTEGRGPLGSRPGQLFQPEADFRTPGMTLPSAAEGGLVWVVGVRRKHLFPLSADIFLLHFAGRHDI